MGMPQRFGERRDAIEAWRRFIAAEGHILRRRPHLLFQQAFNSPAATPQSTAARTLSTAEDRPWIEWLNRPDRGPAWRLSLGDDLVAKTACAFSPDGTCIVSDSRDGLQEWDAETGRQRHVFRGHSDTVYGCWYSHDGSRILSAGRTRDPLKPDDELRVWDRKSGAEIAVYGVRAYAVRCMPDGELVLGKSGDSPLRLWRLSPFKHFRTLTPPGDASVVGDISHDGRLVAAADGLELRIWSTESGLLLAEHVIIVPQLSELRIPARVCQFSPDSSLIALVASRYDREAVVLDTQTGREVLRVGRHEHRFEVTAVCFDPGGSRLATASWDRTVVIWDLRSGRVLQRLRGHAFAVQDCCFSADGHLVASASGDGSLKVWPVGGDGEADADGGNAALACAAAPDGGSVAVITAEPAGLALFHADAKLQEETATLHGESRRSVAFSPDGSRLATASTGSDALLISCMDAGDVRRLVGLKSQVRACAVSPDGRWILGGSSWPDPLIVWDGETACPVKTLSGVRAPLLACAIAPDNSLAAACWEYGPPNLQLWDFTGRRSAPPLAGHASDVYACAFSPDGTTLVSGSYGEIKIWDLRTGDQIRRFATAIGLDVRSIFSRDGRCLLVAEGQVLRVLSVSDGREVARFESDSSYVHALSSSTTMRVYMAGAEGLFRLGLRNLDLGPAIVTPTFLYVYEQHACTPTPVVRCGWCGGLFETPRLVVDAVSAIGRQAAPDVEFPLALDLPPEAWDDSRLQSSCPECQLRLAFNPFFCRAPAAWQSNAPSWGLPPRIVA